MRIFLFLALALAACTSEVNAPPMTKKPTAPVQHAVGVAPTNPTPPHGPPDVAGAQARAQAALQRALDYAKPEARAAIERAIAARQQIFSTNDPVLSNLLTQYQQALIAVNVERYRERSVDGARAKTRGVVALLIQGTEAGPGATILRRPGSHRNLVVLGAEATPATLVAALRAVDHQRAIEGDDLLTDEKLVITAHAASVLTSAEAARFGAMLAALRQAKPKAVEGVGTYPTLAVETARLASR